MSAVRLTEEIGFEGSQFTCLPGSLLFISFRWNKVLTAEVSVLVSCKDSSLRECRRNRSAMALVDIKLNVKHGGEAEQKTATAQRYCLPALLFRDT